MRRQTFVACLLVSGVVLAGCSAHTTSGPQAMLGGSPSDEPAGLLWSMHGTGSAVLRPTVTGHPRRVTVRMTCAGNGKPALRTARGALIMRTDGCKQGVIFSAGFAVTAERDPRVIVLTVNGQVAWAVQLWAGDYDPLLEEAATI